MRFVKYFFILIIGLFLLFSSMLITGPVQGQDFSDLPNPGITPDSFWYFGEIIKERILIIFTFNKQSKVEKYIQFSEERISEIKLMAEKDRYREAAVSADEYISLIQRAEGTVRVIGSDKLGNLKYEINQEVSNQIYYINQISKTNTDPTLKPKLKEAKVWANNLKQSALE